MVINVQSLAYVRELQKQVRQHRSFLPKPVPDDAIQEILDVARWTGSAGNAQPWEFLVVQDPARIERIASLRSAPGFLQDAPLVIIPVLNGTRPRTEPYDEGRVTERIMLAAKTFGLATGISWWGPDEASAAVKQELGIPAEKRVMSAIGIGYPARQTSEGGPATTGRKPLADIVHHETYGNR
jgi:nitroreductase